MPSEVKVSAVEQLTQVLEGAKSVYLTDFTGMPVEMMANLRRRCRESEVEYRVVKDSLTKLAAKRAGLDAVIDYLEGPTGLALGREDELAPARVLIEFAKEHKRPKIKAALVEGRMFTEDGVKTLAVLPTREVLLGQFVSGVMAPLSGLRGVIQQVMWKLVATLQARAEALEKDAPVTTEPAAEPPNEADAAEAVAPETKTAESEPQDEGGAEAGAAVSEEESEEEAPGPESGEDKGAEASSEKKEEQEAGGGEESGTVEEGDEKKPVPEGEA